jgi:biotin operon repressor
MDIMASTSTRTLRLLSLLQSRRYWPGAELAGRLQVSPRTLRRDIDRLRELGYPVQAQRGVEGGYQLAAGAALPPLMIDDTEAVALAIGLQTAAQGAVEDIAESSVRALAKVVQIMPARLRRRVEALGAMTVPASWGSAGTPSVDPGVLTTVALACRDSDRLRLAAAGTWSATTSPGTTGAASVSTASARHAAPGPDSGPVSCPPPTLPLSSGPVSTMSSPYTTLRFSFTLRPRPCASGSAGGLRCRTSTPPAAGYA